MSVGKQWSGLLAALVLSVTGSLAFASQAALRGFQAVPHEVLPEIAKLKPIGPADPSTVLHLAVGLQPARPEALQEFSDSVSDPKSPNYRHFITPEEVGERFGAAQSDVDAVAGFLRAHGMTITLVAKNRMVILADATVAQAREAFKAPIMDFSAANPVGAGTITFHANIQPALVPDEIAPVIIDVSGLETYTRPKPLNTTLLNPPLTRGCYNTAPMYAAAFYGSGRTVAISNWDGYRLTNVPLYYTHFSLPTPSGGAGTNITEVKVDGGSGTGSAGGEGDLDIQMELGMAPLANMRIYDGSGGDLINVLSREVNDNLADCISESYGWSLPSSTANSAHNQHLSMSAQGITYMAASGDSGTSVSSYPYPTCDPEVLVVGGTTATVNSSSGVRVSEVGWSGSGGGWTTTSFTFNKLPSWQKGTGVPTNINYRLMPDVGIHAAGSPGAYQFYYNNGLGSGAIGTSFASPVFAGCLAVSEEKLISLGGLPPDSKGKRRFGRIMDLFYSQNGRADVWHDITSGSNGKLPNGSTSSCTAGWDFVTGWGAPDFNAFVASQGTIGTTECTLTESNISGAIGETVSQTATLVRKSDSAPIVGATVIFTIKDASSGVGTTNSSGVATATYTIPESLGVGDTAIGASFSGDATYATASATATLTVNQANTNLVAPDKSGQPGQKVYVTATLTRATDGAVLPSKSIAFTIDGSTLGSANTSGTGTASYAYTLPDSLAAGSHPIGASFAGNANYNPSSASATLTISKGDTKMTASDAAGSIGNTITLTAKLARVLDSANIVGRSVAFTVAGTSFGSATTDSSGVATLTFQIPPSLAVGANAVVAGFAGDAAYNPSSAGATLTVSSTGSAVSGTVDLDGIVSPNGQSTSLEFRAPGTTTVQYSTTIALDQSGAYTAYGVPYGTYDVACKFSNWLRQVNANTAITDPTTSGVNFSLMNGDANGDNSVGLMDLSVVLANFGTNGADGGDLNRDGNVGLADISLILSNFGIAGAK